LQLDRVLESDERRQVIFRADSLLIKKEAQDSLWGVSVSGGLASMTATIERAVPRTAGNLEL
jgi:hypothetical protein